MKHNPKHQNEKGYTLLLALIFLLALSILAIALLTRTLQEFYVTDVYKQKKIAQNQAEGGLDWALYKLQLNFPNNLNWAGGESTYIDMEGCQAKYKVTVIPDPSNPNQKIIDSYGRCGNQQEHIKATAGYVLPEIFDFALFASGTIGLGGFNHIYDGPLYAANNLSIKTPCAINNANVYVQNTLSFVDNGCVSNGNMYSNGNVILGYSQYGYKQRGFNNVRVYAGGTINRTWGYVDTGQYYANVNPKPFPAPSYFSRFIYSSTDFNTFKSKAQAAGSDHYFSSSKTVNGGIYSGIYYVQGNLTISGTLTGAMVWVASGSCTIPSNLTTNSGGEFALICQGNITDNATAQVNGVLYSNGSITIPGYTNVYGAVLAPNGSISGSGHIDVHYVPIKKTANLLGVDEQFRLINWLHPPPGPLIP